MAQSVQLLAPLAEIFPMAHALQAVVLVGISPAGQLTQLPPDEILPAAQAEDEEPLEVVQAPP